MRNPEDVTIRLTNDSYAMLVYYMHEGTLVFEYVKAPSAVEMLEGKPDDRYNYE
jgi:hypothetical protein